MSKKKMSPKRRKFLKSAAAGGMATLVGGTRVMGSTPPPAPRQTATAMILPEESDPSGINVRTTDRPGADFMLDVIKSLGLEYIASNPGSSFRALQESIATYGGNKNPEFLTCCHEESSVAMAHGYAKIEGKPMGVLAHATVGLQHAAMAIYQRLLRSRAGLSHARQLDRRHDATTRRGVGSQRDRRGGHGPRLHQMGRSPDLAGSLRGIRRPRVQVRDDAADDAGGAGLGSRAAGTSRAGTRQSTHPSAHHSHSATGRLGRGSRSR